MVYCSPLMVAGNDFVAQAADREALTTMIGTEFNRRADLTA